MSTTPYAADQALADAAIDAAAERQLAAELRARPWWSGRRAGSLEQAVSALRELRSRWFVRAFALDLAMLGTAAAIATALSGGAAGSAHAAWSGIFALLVLAALGAGGLYRAPLDLRMIDTARAIVVGTGVATAVVLSVRVLVANGPETAEHAVRSWLLALTCLVAARLTLGAHERRARRAGLAGSRTLIVGAGKVAQLLAKRLDDHREFGLRPIGFLDKEPVAPEDAASALPVLGASWDLDRVVAERRVEHVVFTFSTAPTDVFLRLVKRCQELGLRTSFVPRLYERSTTQATVECLGGLPLVVSHARNPRGFQFRVKYAIDRVGAALLLVVLSPFLALLAVAVWSSLGRPIIYRQERTGRDGRRFEILKFRSMKPATKPEDLEVDLPPDTAPGGVEGADRRTRLGTVMRQLSLDELPQLVNIVRGEMSFIGPRPERPEFVDVFEQSVHRYGERHRVRAGITGWAQVHGLRGQTSLADRIEWDNYYIENWSLWFDLKILLMTVGAVLRPAEAA